MQGWLSGLSMSICLGSSHGLAVRELEPHIELSAINANQMQGSISQP